MTATTFDQSIASLDVSIFQVESQTSVDDRRSFLAIQNAMRQWKKGYVYLECGSHVGGSLLPHLIDPHCRLLYSVDKRPAFQADERGVDYEYRNNSSRRMVETLTRHVRTSDLAKLRTFDTDASELTVSHIQDRPDLVLIDAEHTNAAVFRDFLSLYRICHASTVYAFHDANLLLSGLQNIEAFLRHSGVDFDSYILPNVVYLLAINEARTILRPVGQRFGVNKDRFAAWSTQQLMMYHYDVVRQFMARPQKPGL